MAEKYKNEAEIIAILEAIENNFEKEKQEKEAEDEMMAEVYRLEAEQSLQEGEKALKEAIKKAKETKEYKTRENIGNGAYMTKNYQEKIKEAAKKYLRKTGKFDKHYFYTKCYSTNDDYFIYRWTVMDEDGVEYVYVGQSFNPVKRMYDEVAESKNKYLPNYESRRSTILREVCHSNFDEFLENAKIEILERCSSKKASEREAHWIKQTIDICYMLGLMPLNKEAWAE